MNSLTDTGRAPRRRALFGYACILLAANAIPTFVGEAVQTHGWLVASLNLFDISAIVWIALAAMLALCWQGEGDEAAKASDWAAMVAAALVALFPAPPISGAALSAMGIWGWLTFPKHSPERRAAAIALSLSAFFFWGRLFLALGSGPLLSADAWFVSQVSGMSAQGNTVSFADGKPFLIAPGCSSLHGISLALILWATVVAWFDYRVTARLRWTLVLAVVAAVLVNAARLTMIAWYPRDFDYWHVGPGASIFGWLTLAAVMGVVYQGISGATRDA